MPYAEILDEKIIEEIEAQARLAFTDREISIIVGIPFRQFKDQAEDPESPVYLALNRGRLMAQAEVRKSIMELARSGSKDAQQMAAELFTNLIIDNEE